MIPSLTRRRLRRGRFRLTRAGILNIWQYDDQIFEFHEGRLLLRGKNGSGKTKAMELLLPFLLDADLSPARLDPAGQNVKGMKDNLLDDGQTSRTGYVWIEFGRLDEDDREHYVTLGAGLRASQSAGAEPWYFLTSQRVGHELQLEGDGGQPLTRERLRAAIGAAGRVCDSATDYKETVDQALFGLGKERYHALVNLLIHLRRPQLSKSLDPELLAKALSESLPPLDSAMISRVADAFTELEKQQRALAEVRRSRDAVATFLASYESYAKILSKVKAKAMVDAEAAVTMATQRLEKARTNEETLKATIQRLESDLTRLDKERANLSGEIDALRASPEAKQAASMQQLAQFVNSLRSEASHLRRDVDRLREGIQEDAARIERIAQEAEDSLKAERRCAEEAETAATDARMRGIHEVLREGRDAEGELVPEAEQRWAQQVRRRDLDLGELEKAGESVAHAEKQKLNREQEQKRAEERHRERVEATRTAREEADARRNQAEEAAIAWRGSLLRLQLDDQAFASILTTFEPSEVSNGRHWSILKQVASSQEEELVNQSAAFKAERGRRATEASVLAAEIEQWRTQRDAPPTVPPWQRHARQGRSGAPFYRLVDFREGLDEAARASLEAALFASGLLDAWVRPDGTIDDLQDSYAVQAAPTPGQSLASFLHVIANDDVGEELVEGILRSVPVVPSASSSPGGDGLVIGEDGSWRTGPLVGRTEKRQAEHIGELARERTRQQRIADAEVELQRLNDLIAGQDAQIAENAVHLQLLRSEVDAFPSLSELQRKYVSLTQAIARESDAREALIDAQRRAAAAREEVEKRQRTYRDLARERGLEDVLPILSTARSALVAYQNACHRWFRALDASTQAKRTLTEKRDALEDRKNHLKETEARFQEKDATASAKESELDTLRKTAGKAVEKLERELQKASARLSDVEKRIKSSRQDHMKKYGDHREAGVKREQAEGVLIGARRTRNDAAEALALFQTTGLIELCLGQDVPEIDELQLAHLIVEQTQQVVDTMAALEEATNFVYPRFQALSRDLPTEYTATGGSLHGALVVTIAHAGKESTARQMHANLREEAELQTALLEKREADLIQKHLFGEVSSQIRSHIRQAAELVRKMNQELESHPTASGLQMKLNWNLDPEIGKPSERALTAIRKAQNLLTDRERALVTEFLQDCQERAREEMPTATQADQLMRALDYRRWYRFDLYWKKPGQTDFARLTKKSHATGSAGEKAVALYLPLFSAAAAHFDSAREHAPRLVLLDEVFAGVDQGTRGSCMGLLVAFDVDVMMTAFNEWGCYPEVPGIAIYHLERDASIRGVLATPFWWDGTKRVPLEPEASS